MEQIIYLYVMYYLLRLTINISNIIICNIIDSIIVIKNVCNFSNS